MRERLQCEFDALFDGEREKIAEEIHLIQTQIQADNHHLAIASSGTVQSCLRVAQDDLDRARDQNAHLSKVVAQQRETLCFLESHIDPTGAARLRELFLLLRTRPDPQTAAAAGAAAAAAAADEAASQLFGWPSARRPLDFAAEAAAGGGGSDAGGGEAAAEGGGASPARAAARRRLRADFAAALVERLSGLGGSGGPGAAAAPAATALMTTSSPPRPPAFVSPPWLTSLP
jgi:hypothetical protein